MTNNTNKVNGAVQKLIKFGDKLEEVSKEIDSSIGHLQIIEEEVAGEGSEIQGFTKKEVVPLIKEFRETGDLDHNELVRLVQDESRIGETVEKVTQDVETEINELKNLGRELVNLENMAQEAEEALEVLEEFQESQDRK